MLERPSATVSAAAHCAINQKLITQMAAAVRVSYHNSDAAGQRALMERPMVSRMVGVAVIFWAASAFAADGTFARMAGFGFSVTPGARNSTSTAPSHATPPWVALPGHRDFTLRALPSRQFAFGFPLTTFGYGFLPSLPDYNLQMVQIDFSAPPLPLGACSSFYCPYYDPSHATYVDPYRSRYGSARPSGCDVGPAPTRQGCDSETVTISADSDAERSIKVLRC
jgi:hypothetical protein